MTLALISQKIKLAEAIRYALSRWQGLTRFIDDGRIELDNNTVERSIRGIKLSRKNALFAGSDGGAEHWAVVATLVETCKINDVDPLAYPTDALARIVNGHSNRDIEQLLPWAYRAVGREAIFAHAEEGEIVPTQPLQELVGFRDLIDRLDGLSSMKDIYLKGCRRQRGQARARELDRLLQRRRLHQSLGYRTPMAVWRERIISQ